MWDRAELHLGEHGTSGDYCGYHIIAHGTDVSEEPERFDAVQFIESTVAEFAGRGVDGVMASDDYPGSIVASVIAREMKLPGADPAVILRCQHKYYARVAQRIAVPEAVPEFALIDAADIGHAAPPLFFPMFVKPVKSFFSLLAERVEDAASLARLARNAEPHLHEFVKPFNQLLARYSDLALGGGYLIAESPLGGVQVTVEGCVFRGDVEIIGVTDSVMYPGTISFERFEYPSALPEDVQRRMAELATRFVKSVGFDNSLFNIEMFYDPRSDAIHFIEINPRMCPQFADMMEKVNGVNTYRIALDIAAGVQPTICDASGRYPFAASFALRLFQDARVLRVPDPEELAEFHERFPDARLKVLCRPEHRLSDELQDGKSYRYAVLNIGGDSRSDLLLQRDRALERLSFGFEPLASGSPHPTHVGGSAVVAG